MFQDDVAVIVTRIMNQTPSTFSAEVTDVVRGDSWLLFDRTGFARDSLGVEVGDALLIKASKARANRSRYGSHFPVLQAKEVRMRSRSA
jgi:hypothetical protein